MPVSKRIDATCAACGAHYRDRPERIGSPGFCSRACRTSEAATEARFLAKIRREDGGCWLWTGGLTRTGYGKFGGTGLAHRYAYQRFIGQIPAGMQLDHLCRNRACCNPSHLEPVTGRENLLRGDTWQARNAAKTHCPQGHEYTPENTYRYADGRRKCRACGRDESRRRRIANIPSPEERAA